MRRIPAIAAVVLLTGAVGWGLMRWRHGPSFPQQAHEASLTCTCCQDPYFHKLLGLDDDQKAQLITLDDDFNEKSLAFGDTLTAQRSRLADLMQSVAQDDPRIDQCVQNISTAQVALERLVVQHLYDIKAILTEEQHQRFLSVVLEDLGRDQP